MIVQSETIYYVEDKLTVCDTLQNLSENNF